VSLAGHSLAHDLGDDRHLDPVQAVAKLADEPHRRLETISGVPPHRLGQGLLRGPPGDLQPVEHGSGGCLVGTARTDAGLSRTDIRSGPVNACSGPVNARSGPIITCSGPIITCSGPIITCSGPVNTCSGPIHTRGRAANVGSIVRVPRRSSQRRHALPSEGGLPERQIAEHLADSDAGLWAVGPGPRRTWRDDLPRTLVLRLLLHDPTLERTTDTPWPSTETNGIVHTGYSRSHTIHRNQRDP